MLRFAATGGNVASNLGEVDVWTGLASGHMQRVGGVMAEHLACWGV
jgi:hypothetical protein